MCLLANTAPVAFGSIGIPIVTLANVTGLPINPVDVAVNEFEPAAGPSVQVPEIPIPAAVVSVEVDDSVPPPAVTVTVEPAGSQAGAVVPSSLFGRVHEIGPDTC